MSGVNKLKEVENNLSTNQKNSSQSKKELATNLQPQTSTEIQAEKFCSIDLDQLTKTQKKLFDKLTPVQREEFEQKVSINTRDDETGWYIQFIKLQWNNTIAGRNIAGNVNKKGADDAIKKLWNGWELPRDADYTYRNRFELDAANSDYDAMILQMPGLSDNERVENFRLLTGMHWDYRTAQKYNKSISDFVTRSFYEDRRMRSWRNSDTYHVRPVRSL